MKLGQIVSELSKAETRIKLTSDDKPTWSVSFGGVRFVGQLNAANFPDGFGEIFFPSGERYLGSFANGEVEGFGVYWYRSGAVFAGQWKKSEKEGYGRFLFQSGANYEGNFVGGLPNGRGVISYTNGASYVGDFANGLRNGFGSISSSSGNRYEGAFENDLFSGWGTLIIPGGVTYDGQWSQGLQSGSGSLIHPNATFSGDFKAGKIDGNPALVSSEIPSSYVTDLHLFIDGQLSESDTFVCEDPKPEEGPAVGAASSTEMESLRALYSRCSSLARKLSVLSVLPLDFDKSAVATIFDALPDFEIEVLQREGLIDSTPSGRYRISVMGSQLVWFCGYEAFQGGRSSMSVDLANASPSLSSFATVVRYYLAFLAQCGKLFDSNAVDCQKQALASYDNETTNIEISLAFATPINSALGNSGNQLANDLCDCVRSSLSVLKHRLHPDQILPITEKLLGGAGVKSIVEKDRKIAAALLASHALSSRGVGMSGQTSLLTDASATAKELAKENPALGEVDVCDVNIAMARAHFVQDDLKQSSALIEATLAIVRRTQHPRLLCETLTLKGNALMSDPAGAPLGRDILNQALELAKKTNNNLSIALINSILHIFESVFGDKEKAGSMQSAAVEVAQAHKCRALECNIHVFKGKALLRQGKTPEAIDCLRVALVLSKRCGALQKEALCESSLGSTYLKTLNRPERSIDHFKRARSIYTLLSKPVYEALQLHLIGTAHMKLREIEVAQDTFKAALALAQKNKAKALESTIAESMKELKILATNPNPDPNNRSAFSDPESIKKLKQASDYSQRGATSFKNGEYLKALNDFNLSLPLYKELKSTPSVISTMFSIVNAHLKMRNVDEARAQLEDALKVCKGANDDQNAAQALIKLGNIYKDTNENEEAVKAFEEALKIVEDAKNQVLQGTCYMHLGTLYTKLGKPKEAVKNFEKSLEIAKSTQNQKSQCQVQLELARSYFSLGDFATAIRLCEESLEVIQETKNRNLEGVALFNISVFCVPVGQIARAMECCEKSIEIAKELRSKESEVTREKHLANLRSKLLTYQLQPPTPTQKTAATPTAAVAPAPQQEEGEQKVSAAPRKSAAAPATASTSSSAVVSPPTPTQKQQQQQQQPTELSPEPVVSEKAADNEEFPELKPAESTGKRQRECCGGACATQ